MRLALGGEHLGCRGVRFLPLPGQWRTDIIFDIDMKDWTGNKTSTFTVIGASNHTDKERERNDYYATDPIAIDGLSKVVGLPRNVWECACGAGHLSERMREMGCNVYSSDKIDRGYGKVMDFLASTEMPTGFECIITNPPYKYALEFVEHSLALLPDGGMCAMFLKTTFLEGQKRYDRIFKNTPPRVRVAVLEEGSLRQERRVSAYA